MQTRLKNLPEGLDLRLDRCLVEFTPRDYRVGLYWEWHRMYQHLAEDRAIVYVRELHLWLVLVPMLSLHMVVSVNYRRK